MKHIGYLSVGRIFQVPSQLYPVMGGRKLVFLLCLIAACSAWPKLDSAPADRSSSKSGEDLEVGYNGKLTPSCVDGTIYATSRSKCDYPRDDIQSWIKSNPERMEDLYRNVPVQVRKPQASGVFPKHVDGVESCNYIEDYPELRWVYSFDDGWLPVVQTPRYRQYYRLEFCSSPQCTATPGGQCKTFESRTQVLAWNGKEVVGTTVLLQTSCKCVLGDSASDVVDPGFGVPAPEVTVCNPYTDCSCDCPPGDASCFIHRRLVCPDDAVSLPIVAPIYATPIIGDRFRPYWWRRHRHHHHLHRHHRFHHHRFHRRRSSSGSHEGSRRRSSSGSHEGSRRRRFWRRGIRHHSGSRSGSHSASRSGSHSGSHSNSRSGSHERRHWWRRRHHGGSRSWSRSRSDERSCDPYTDCSCPCGNYHTRRHCLDYRRRNNICGRDQYEAVNDYAFPNGLIEYSTDEEW